MNTIEKLQQKLEDPQFFKRHIPNVFFIFSSWKKDHQRYQEADKRRIVTNHLLRRSEHEDFFYNTYAICTSGDDIERSQVEQLRQLAQNLALGEIRYMAHGANGFFPLVDENGAIVDAPDIKLGIPDVYIFTVSDTNAEKIDCPYSVVIWKGRELKKWPLSQKAVNEA